ncbi:putative lipoprotein [Shigella flexneri 1485-80]|nr:putative lipoprotein [Shigella flexneri 1485-80]
MPATLTRSPFWCFASASACFPKAITPSQKVDSPASAALQGRDTASRAIAMLLPFVVVRVWGSATSRPYAEICAVIFPSLDY